jgi:hypothetical protein
LGEWRSRAMCLRFDWYGRAFWVESGRRRRWNGFLHAAGSRLLFLKANTVEKRNVRTDK